MADALHIQRMAAKARALGAGSAAPLPARAVVVDERVNFKCRVPLCASYGVNLMCPPNTPTAAETPAALARYSDALVVQQDIPLTQTAVDEALGGMSYAEAQAQDADGTAGERDGRAAGAGQAAYQARLRESQNEFARLMSALEAEAFKMGYRFAAAFAGGDCVLCDVCAGADGLAIELPADDHPRWTGLLLID